MINFRLSRLRPLLAGLFPLVLMSAGCVSLTLPLHPDRVYVTADSITKFNGLYEEVSIDSINNFHPMLWSLLAGGSSFNYSNKQLQIVFLSETLGRANLVVDGEVVKTGKFRGKLQDGCFYLRREFMIIPFFPLLYGFTSKKERLCLLADCVVIDASWNERTFILFWGGGGKGQGSFRFPKATASDVE